MRPSSTHSLKPSCLGKACIACEGHLLHPYCPLHSCWPSTIVVKSSVLCVLVVPLWMAWSAMDFAVPMGPLQGPLPWPASKYCHMASIQGKNVGIIFQNEHHSFVAVLRCGALSNIVHKFNIWKKFCYQWDHFYQDGKYCICLMCQCVRHNMNS